MSSDTEIDQFISDVFDDNEFGGTKFNKESIIDRLRLESAERTIRGVTLNSYIIDIFRDATNLRNVLGDMDGYAAEVAQNIRTNVLVVASLLKKKPSRLIIDSLRALPQQEAVKIAEKTVSDLNDFIAVLQSEHK